MLVDKIFFLLNLLGNTQGYKIICQRRKKVSDLVNQHGPQEVSSKQQNWRYWLIASCQELFNYSFQVLLVINNINWHQPSCTISSWAFNQYVSFADAIIFSLKTSFSDFHRILFLPALQIKKVYTNNTIYERAIVTGLRYVSYLSQTNN